jgi:hypothetical protein
MRLTDEPRTPQRAGRATFWPPGQDFSGVSRLATRRTGATAAANAPAGRPATRIATPAATALALLIPFSFFHPRGAGAGPSRKDVGPHGPSLRLKAHHLCPPLPAVPAASSSSVIDRFAGSGSTGGNGARRARSSPPPRVESDIFVPVCLVPTLRIGVAAWGRASSRHRCATQSVGPCAPARQRGSERTSRRRRRSSRVCRSRSPARKSDPAGCCTFVAFVDSHRDVLGMYMMRGLAEVAALPGGSPGDSHGGGHAVLTGDDLA